MDTANRIFELRTYEAAPGKLEALVARFRDHTVSLFARHGIEFVAFFTEDGADDQPGRVIYLLAFPDREAATASWAAFQDDPEWKAARAASETDGRLTAKIESVSLRPTDFSPLR